MSAREELYLFLAIFGPLLAVFLVVAVFGNDPAGWLSDKWERLTARFKPVKEESNG